ncbi:hypothetical protein CEXT_48621 [Caerostris extrusa]|uniref:Uncharacterized protein n=1 Tax=Caerostris extrusa TaxID=172846 RepID=A0AAV4N291_CAEEX|nr:hypothetical protein CEXT_48621 [Caerostris extrusa]
MCQQQNLNNVLILQPGATNKELKNSRPLDSFEIVIPLLPFTLLMAISSEWDSSLCVISVWHANRLTGHPVRKDSVSPTEPTPPQKNRHSPIRKCCIALHDKCQFTISM